MEFLNIQTLTLVLVDILGTVLSIIIYEWMLRPHVVRWIKKTLEK